MLDLIIRGARVVDGSGAPGRTADVGVTDGRIVEVGRIGSSAQEVFDADGLVVAPGFIDVHTHYDAQVFWDSALTPSPQHGVTTVISGNCGFTLAPLHAPDAAYLTQMLARVEGMPRTALESGLSWDWESVGDYLAAVEQRGVSINAGFLAGHSTLRRHVMGERSGERSTPEDISLLERALDTALAEGALGLSTSDSATHSDESHEPVPSRIADDAELLALAAVLRSRSRERSSNACRRRAPTPTRQKTFSCRSPSLLTGPSTGTSSWSTPNRRLWPRTASRRPTVRGGKGDA